MSSFTARQSIPSADIPLLAHTHTHGTDVSRNRSRAEPLKDGDDGKSMARLVVNYAPCPPDSRTATNLHKSHLDTMKIKGGGLLSH